jgi:uncharacterized protein YndB with AHSA1/START domain
MLERVFRIDINAPVSRVWDEITRRGVAHPAMFGTYLHAEMKPGSVMSYRDKSEKHTFVLGKILEVDPPRRLVHTFRFSMEADEPTLVVWELAESGGGTRVTVTHSRFAGETRTYKSVSTSWPKILGIYKRQIESNSVALGVRMLNGMMMGMSFMLPKKAGTETAMRLPLDVPPG